MASTTKPQTLRDRIEALPEPKRTEVIEALEVFRPLYRCHACGELKPEVEMEGPDTCLACAEECDLPAPEYQREIR